jgi:lipid II:glycine glycyltransferase (peptidoglycan interpeptide bridge formation enzyme)
VTGTTRSGIERWSGALTVEHVTDAPLVVLEEWDDLVERSQAGDVAQLSTWAEIRASSGFRSAFVFVRRGSRVVAGAQILCRRIPVFGALGYLPYGPVIEPGAPHRAAVTELLVAELSRVARTFRMMFVQPPVGAEDLSSALLAAGFRRSDALIAPAASVRLDLTVPEQALVRRLNRRLRTWTRQWPKRGVTVRVGGSADVAILADLLARTASHHGFTPFPEHYLRLLHDKLAERGKAVLLIGEVNGRAMAAELFTACGTVVTTRLCGLDRDPEAARRNVASAVTWEAIRWAKAHGYDSFDFGGLRPEALDVLRADPTGDTGRVSGPDQYKLKFGGDVVRYPDAVELISAPAVRVLYDVARRHPLGRGLVAMARRLLRGVRR